MLKLKNRIKISNIFMILENLGESVDTIRAQETVTENIKTSAKENLRCFKLKQNKPQFEEECSKLYKRKQTLFEYLQTMT
jgi:hypothetical protein